MKRLRSRKFCAALVIIAWVATLVAFWGMDDAGRRAVALEKGCQASELQNLGLKLEMATTAGAALEILDGDGDPAKAACLRGGAAAQVQADSLLFIPAYSGLVLALFLFVRSLWITPPRNRSWAGQVLLVVGLLLVGAMAAGDFTENRYLHALIRLAAQARPLQDDAFSSLVLAGRIKWGALAASALLLAVFWTAKTSRFLIWVPRVCGIVAGAFLIAGLSVPSVDIVSAGSIALFLFWLTALVQAVAVAAESMQDGSPSPGGTVQP